MDCSFEIASYGDYAAYFWLPAEIGDSRLPVFLLRLAISLLHVSNFEKKILSKICLNFT